jgi:heme exporter protein D
MNLGPHASYIIGAYAAGALIVLALMAWVALDYRRQLRVLAELDAQGVTRRSDRAAGEAT